MAIRRRVSEKGVIVMMIIVKFIIMIIKLKVIIIIIKFAGSL